MRRVQGTKASQAGAGIATAARAPERSHVVELGPPCMRLHVVHGGAPFWPSVEHADQIPDRTHVQLTKGQQPGSVHALRQKQIEREMGLPFLV